MTLAQIPEIGFFVQNSRIGVKLNSGIRNRNNFFVWATFLFQNIENGSVNRADSGDIQFLVQFPGNWILKSLQNFWKCVGGAYRRRCFNLKITQGVQLFTLISFIHKIKGIHFILCQPTQFSPPNFSIFGRFSFKTIFAPTPTTTTLVSKDVEFSCASFEICKKFARWCPPTQTPTQKLKIGFPKTSSREIGSSLVSFQIIFEALQS